MAARPESGGRGGSWLMPGRAYAVAGDMLCVWTAPPPGPAASFTEVHLWRVPLAAGRGQVECLSRALSAEERSRAARLHFERDRRRFTIAHGALRAVLGAYLALEPEAVPIRHEARGKPVLGACAAARGIHFSLSHSARLALLAVALERRVGVDLEYARAPRDGDEIARRFFAKREVEALAALPPARRRRAFFHAWTRKEAYLKAVGLGLAMPLDQVEVTVAPGEPARLLRAGPDPGEAARWTLRALEPARGYVAALAVEGGEWTLRGFEAFHSA